MMFEISCRKRIATGLLLIWVINLLTPNLVFALTSGPAQPEAQAFQPAGVSDMVDLGSGDFKYNIPLLDVDGYPVNLTYQSGVSMDDEASWVGLGWNLNVGAINRQLRGLPDDFSGDEIKTEHYTKPKITIGAKGTFKVELKGAEKSVKLPKILKKKFGDKDGKAKSQGGIGGSISLGIFSDNYTGVGAEVGANAGISLSLGNDGEMTSGLGLGITSNTTSGAGFDVSPYLNLAIKQKSTSNTIIKAGASTNFGFNTISGTKDVTLSASYSLTNYFKKMGYGYDGSATTSILSYNTEPINPSVTIPYKTDYGSFNFDAGPSEVAIFLGGGGTGYVSVRSVRSESNVNKGYGFLYADRAKLKADALMDFVREKDNPIIPEIPNIALPVHTPDLFSYTSQSSSGQFRLYRGTGAFGDNTVEESASSNSLGGDLGFGATNTHLGVKFFNQTSNTVSRRWVSGNGYLQKGDFQDTKGEEPEKDPVFFKVSGERNAESRDLNANLKDNGFLVIPTSGRSTSSSFINQGGSTVATGDLEIKSKQIKRTVVSYLTAEEASSMALDSKLNYYALNEAGSFSNPQACPEIEHQEDRVDRTGDTRKPHHISEIAVTDEGGKRLVYGMPVYNYVEDEVSFAIGRQGSNYTLAGKNTMVFGLNSDETRPDHIKGVDNYYHKESKPPYASSFLLTAILSPDYVDMGKKGISPDDKGTAIKFNYSKLNKRYCWRSPFGNKTATVNKGLLADVDDDKGTFVYGEKELCYLHSIETKTQIAYFITESRTDGLGVENWKGAVGETAQRKLTEIILYSKADMTRPIKHVKFSYASSAEELCKNTPNSNTVSFPKFIGGGGKLTLKKVWFEYGNTTKGKNHPYEFNYKISPNDSFAVLSSDRWGTYKPDAENPSLMYNDVYPYSAQDKSKADLYAGLWHLNSIKLPTGGKIGVSYESDDYAYVQNKKAMRMQPFLYLIDKNGNQISQTAEDAIIRSAGMRIKLNDDLLPAAGIPNGADVIEWFRNGYLNGSEYLYSKLYVKMHTGNSVSHGAEYDYVPCYSKITGVQVYGKEVNVFFEMIKEKGATGSPICIAAWQRLKNEYPRHAYIGYDNRADDGSASMSLKRAVKAVLNSFSRVADLFESFYSKAQRLSYGGTYNHGLSFIRLVKTDGYKLGGGSRVSKITINDDWSAMSASSAATGVYGQSYSYSTTEGTRTISSGVASYEPSVGGDENPWRQPVPYIQNIKGAINNYFSLEEPFGESLFPAPSVVYSKVTVRDLAPNGVVDQKPATGSILNEFYTAKDFPVIVKRSNIEDDPYTPVRKYRILSTNSVEELALYQGYSIELNDMHGKPKAVRVLNQAGVEISSTQYNYKTGGDGKLDNTVKVIEEDGEVTDRVVGREVEFYTDVREQINSNSGVSVNLGLDFTKPVFLVPHFPKPGNTDSKLFRSISAMKTIQYFGILDEVVKSENGSSISTKNVAYDGLTGEALITKTQNEYDRDIYSVNLPAYWIYKGMGPAYKNLGTVFSNLATSSDGVILNSNYGSLLHAGDEVCNLTSSDIYWVIENDHVKRLIDKDGHLLKGNTIAYAKVLRSGFRNLLTANSSSIVCLNNPIEKDADGKSRFAFAWKDDLQRLKIMNASAQTFNEEWAVENVRITGSAAITTDAIIPGPNMVSNGLRDANHGEIYDVSSYWDSPKITGTEKKDPNKGAYSRCGIRLPEDQADYSTDSSVSNVDVGIETFFDIPSEGEYSVVFTGDANRSHWEIKSCRDPNFLVKGESPASIECNTTHVILNRLSNNGAILSAGRYKIDYRFGVYGYKMSNDSEQPRTGGFEIYRNSLGELIKANETGSDLTLVTSSRKCIGTGRYRVYKTVRKQNGSVSTTYLTPNVYDFCDFQPSRTDFVVNPYFHGYLGNWRPFESKVYQENRYSPYVVQANSRSAGVRDAGHFNSFQSFFTRTSTGWEVNPAAAKWITGNSVTLYDRSGQELENRDALGRYSSAKFDFNDDLPGAVASNAMYREVYANSFEDYKFRLPNNDCWAGASGNGDEVAEFIHPFVGKKIYNYVSSKEAHTGNYSVLLPAEGLRISTKVHGGKQKSSAYTGFSLTDHTYNLFNSDGLYPAGFEPAGAKRYLFTAWVKDDAGASKMNLKLKYSVNGGTTLPFKCKAVVEGWKLVECDFITGGAGNFLLQLHPDNDKVFIDDIRIHPYDSHVKSYAYNDKNFKLMAELDENAFATFYEYDDEGSLTRVKKETERGIITIKETRSSYRKN